MSEIAKYLRIVHLTLDDELVTKRETAIKDLSGRFKKSTYVSDLFKVANNLVRAADASGGMPEDLSTMVESALKKVSKSFVAEDSQVEMLVCASLAALHFMEPKRPKGQASLTCNDLVAIGLWSGLSFQVPRTESKLEELRQTVSARAMAYTLAAGERTRQRDKVPDVTLKDFGDLEPATIKTVTEEGLKETVETLRGNAAVDREEIDLLWWALSGWSNLLDRPYDQKDLAAASALAAGLEAGQKMRGMPVTAHRHLLRRFVNDGPSLSLLELIEVVSADRTRLASLYADNPHVKECPEVFPLIAALTSSEVEATPSSERKYSLVDWANRALLESAALYVASKTPRVTL